MDENQKIETTIVEEKKVDDKNYSFWKLLGLGLLIFFATYCAAYTLIDMHMKSMMRPPFMNSRYNKFDKMINRDIQRMNKVFDDTMREEMSVYKQTHNLIHMEQTPQEYKIKIDLKSFDNNPDNITISTNDDTLTINGRSIKKSKNSEKISRIQQSYMFEKDIDLDKMSKSVDKNILTIVIPIDDTKD